MAMAVRWGIAAAGLALTASASAAHAQADLEEGFTGALRGCEEWVLRPSSWAEGPEPFQSAVGLGSRMMRVRSVDKAALPPPDMRVGNQYWRINAAPDAGYVLVVSDRLPMCHITGGGGRDLQPAIALVLASDDFQSRWVKAADRGRGEMISTSYRNREDPSFTLIVSRAREPGQRLDRVQVLATAMFAVED